MPMRMIVQDKMNAGLASLMKSSLVARMRWNIGSDLIQLWSSRKLKISRVTTSAVNRLAATPMVSVTPKPLISPVPMKIRMIGRNQRRDVRIENRAEGAGVTGGDGAAQRFALGQFLADALVNQHVRVHRHADGEHHARDARQRERRADGAHHPEQDDDVGDQRDVRHDAREQIINQHERGNQNDADNGRRMPLRIESRPSVGSTS